MKRPSVPGWHHDLNKWVFEGKIFPDVRTADYNYTIRLMEYCDFIEAENARLRRTLEQLADDKGAAYWTAKEVQDIARQALNADGGGKCTCADNQGGACASCMETKYNL